MTWDDIQDPSISNTFYFYKKSNTVFITSSEYCVGKKKKKGYKEELLKNIEIVKIVSLSTTNKIKL